MSKTAQIPKEPKYYGFYKIRLHDKWVIAEFRQYRPGFNTINVFHPFGLDITYHHYGIDGVDEVGERISLPDEGALKKVEPPYCPAP